jgi:putative hydrolases of HD superfamily
MEKNGDLKRISDFLFEAGMLAKTPRSWSYFLGSGDQSIAEHISRTVYIGFALSQISKRKLNEGKILEMCLFHDFGEARTSDLNYIYQKYVQADEEKAVKDLVGNVPFGGKIWDVLNEYKQRISYESLLAKDADNLEFLLSLKEQIDVGNSRAKTWIPSLLKRFKTKEAKQLAKIILKTESDHWWFANKNDKWWVNRNKKAKAKRF